MVSTDFPEISTEVLDILRKGTALNNSRKLILMEFVDNPCILSIDVSIWIHKNLTYRN